MSISKVTVITASSAISWEDAVKTGVSRASKTLRNIVGVKLLDQKAKIENNKISEYRVVMEIIFILDE